MTSLLRQSCRVIAVLVFLCTGSVDWASACIPSTRYPSAADCNGDTQLVAVDASKWGPGCTLTSSDCLDDQPVGERQPLLLVHGIHGNEHSLDGLLEGLRTTYDVSRYKFFIFRYTSNRHSVYTISQSLRNHLDHARRADPTLAVRKLTIVAHSMGGLVARSYMHLHNHYVGELSSIDQRAGVSVSTLITLGTPHHGTPAANDQPRFNLDPGWSLVADAFTFLYWTREGCASCAFAVDQPNRADLRFDNYDNRWTWWNLNLTEYVLNESEKNRFLADLPHDFDNKIIAYAGRLLNLPTAFRNPFADVVVGTALGKVGAFWALSRHDAVELTAIQAAAAILERVWSGHRFLPLMLADNDGVVPAPSAVRDDKKGVWPPLRKVIYCNEYNHNDLATGKADATCGGKTLWDSVAADLALPRKSAPPGLLVVIPAALDFGRTALGQSKLSSVTVTNRATTAVSVTSARIDGSGATDFSTESSQWPLTVQPGQSLNVTIRFLARTSGDRQATLTISNSSAAPQVTVGLAGHAYRADCNYALSSYVSGWGPAGGTGVFLVSTGADCPWRLVSSASWVSNVSPSSGVGNAMVTFSVGASDVLRGASITLEGPAQPIQHGVAQNLPENRCTVSAVPAAASASEAGGTVGLGVQTASGCAWTAASETPWLRVAAGGAGTGPGSVSVVADPTPLTTSRVGVVRVAAAGGSAAFTVTQSGLTACSYTIAEPQRSVSQASGTGTISVTAPAGCQWRASERGDWINITGTYVQTGSGSFGYSYAENTSPVSRTAAILVEGGGASPAVFTLTQSGITQPVADIELPSTTVDVGEVLVGQTGYHGVLFRNVGATGLALYAVYREGGSGTLSASPAPFWTPAGHADAVAVQFQPMTTGLQTATFVLETNDPDEPFVRFTLRGTGVTQVAGGTDFTWTTKDPAPSGADYALGVSLGNYVYVLGGQFSNTLKRYEPATGTWTNLMDRSYLKDGGGAALNGKIYAVGGMTGSELKEYTPPPTNGWTDRAALGVPRRENVLVAAGGKLYAIGGWLHPSGSISGAVEEFDPTRGAWTRKADMPTPRAAAAAVEYGGRIYVFGGVLGNSASSKKNEVYDPATDTWAQAEEMPYARAYARAFVLNSKMFVVGGSNGSTNTLRVDEFDPSIPDADPWFNDAWSERAPISAGRLNPAVGVVNDKVYVISGYSSSAVEEGVINTSPRLLVPTAPITFGEVPVGVMSERLLTVQNVGTAVLNLSHWFTSGHLVFSRIVEGTLPIPPGQSVRVRIRVVPTSAGPLTGALRLTSDDPEHLTTDIPVSAVGVQVPADPRGSWEETESVALSGSGQDIAVAVDEGKLYVLRVGPTSLVTIDLASLALTEVPLPGVTYPRGLAVRSGRAYVSRELAGEVTVVDAATGATVGRVSVSPGPGPLLIVGARLFVAQEAAFSNGTPSVLTAIDLASLTVAAQVPVAPGGVRALAYDALTDSVLVAAGEHPSMTVHGFAATTLASAGSVPMGYVQSLVAQGGLAYASGSTGLHVIDIRSLRQVAHIPSPDSPAGVTLTPNYIGLITRDGLVPIDRVTLRARPVVSVSSASAEPTWHLATPGGDDRVLVVARQRYPEPPVVREIRLLDPGFSLTCSSTSDVVAPGGGATVTCSVTARDRFSAALTYGCAGLPPGSACTAVPQAGAQADPADAGASQSIQFSLPVGAPPGLYSLEVSAAGGGRTSSSVVPFIVPTCAFSIGDGQAITLPAAGGATRVAVGATTGCAWTATSGSAWLTPSSGASGAGNGTVVLSTSGHIGAPRTTTLTIGDQQVSVTQGGLVFTDEPLQARATAVRAVHVTELRQAVDGLRARFSLPTVPWTDAQVVPGSSVVRAAHVTELRAALAAVYQAAGRAAPVFSPTTIDAGLTTITAAQVQGLRNAVLGVW